MPNAKLDSIQHETIKFTKDGVEFELNKEQIEEMPPSFGGIALLSSQQVGLTKEQYEAVDACLKQEMKTKEPPWIPWHGGSNPIVGEQTKYEIEIRNGERFTCAENDLRWSHTGSIGDIIAYRIL